MVSNGYGMGLREYNPPPPSHPIPHACMYRRFAFLPTILGWYSLLLLLLHQRSDATLLGKGLHTNRRRSRPALQVVSS